MAPNDPSAIQRRFVRTLLSPDVQLDLTAALERTGVRLERYYQWLGEERFVEYQREWLRRYNLSLEPALHAAVTKALDKPERWAVDLLVQMNGLNEGHAQDEKDLWADDDGDDGSRPEKLIQRIRALAELADQRFGEAAARRAGGNGDGAAGEAFPPPLARAAM